MAGTGIVPVEGQPGVLMNQNSGQTFRVGNAQKQLIYDEVVVAAGAMVTNTQFKFFDNLTNKNAMSTNALNQRRIPAGTIFQIQRAGVYMESTYGNTLTLGADIRKAYENAFLDFKVNSVQVGLGPLLHFPGGYGVAGFTVESGQSVLSNGIANEAAPLGVQEPIWINDGYDIIPVVTFGSRVYDSGFVTPTFTNAQYMRFELLGTLYTAATL